MKKKILSGVFALALHATAGFGVNKSMKSDVKLSDLALVNVEALAINENSNPCGDNNYHAPNQILKQLKCITANKQNGHMLSCVNDSGKCCDPTKQTHCQ